MWDYTWNTHNLARKLNPGGTFQWVLESYSDADWSFKQSNDAIYLMRGALHQWLFHVCKQQESESGFIELM